MLSWAVLVCPLLLPLSYLWDVFSYWRLVISYWLARISSSPHKRHRAKVQAVQEQVNPLLLSLDILLPNLLVPFPLCFISPPSGASLAR